MHNAIAIALSKDVMWSTHHAKQKGIEASQTSVAGTGTNTNTNTGPKQNESTTFSTAGVILFVRLRWTINAWNLFVLALFDLGATADTSSTASGNHTSLSRKENQTKVSQHESHTRRQYQKNNTYLGTRRRITTAGRGVTNVLVVASTVGVLNGVHGHTTDLGPFVTLDMVLVVGTTSLEKRLVKTTTTGNETDRCTGFVGDGLLHARWKADLGTASIFVVGHNDAVGTGSTSECTTISGAVFEVANDSTFGDLVQWKDVSNSDLGLGSAVHELTSVHTLGGKEVLLVVLEPVSVTEHNLCDWGTFGIHRQKPYAFRVGDTNGETDKQTTNDNTCYLWTQAHTISVQCNLPSKVHFTVRHS